MFKQVFRVAFITLIWKQYKHIIVSTLLLFIYLFLVSSLHADYLSNAKIQNNADGVGISFVYKWLAFTTGVIVYFAVHWIRGRKTSAPSQKTTDQKISKSTGAVTELTDEDDPFAAIRARKNLRSRADFLEGKE